MQPTASLIQAKATALHTVQQVEMSEAQSTVAQIIVASFDEFSVTLLSRPEQAETEIFSALDPLLGREPMLLALARELGAEVLKHPAAMSGQMFTMHISRADNDNATQPEVGGAITRLVMLPTEAESGLRGNMPSSDVAAFIDGIKAQRALRFTAYPSFIEDQSEMEDESHLQKLEAQQLERVAAMQRRMLSEAIAASAQSLSAQTVLIGVLKQLHNLGAQIAVLQQESQSATSRQQLGQAAWQLSETLKQGAVQVAAMPENMQHLRVAMGSWQKNLRSSGLLSAKQMPKIAVVKNPTAGLRAIAATVSRLPAAKVTAARNSLGRTLAASLIAASSFSPTVAVAAPLRAAPQVMTESRTTVDVAAPRADSSVTVTFAEKPTQPTSSTTESAPVQVQPSAPPAEVAKNDAAPPPAEAAKTAPQEAPKNEAPVVTETVGTTEAPVPPPVVVAAVVVPEPVVVQPQTVASVVVATATVAPSNQGQVPPTVSPQQPLATDKGVGIKSDTTNVINLREQPVQNKDDSSPALPTAAVRESRSSEDKSPSEVKTTDTSAPPTSETRTVTTRAETVEKELTKVEKQFKEAATEKCGGCTSDCASCPAVASINRLAAELAPKNNLG